MHQIFDDQNAMFFICPAIFFFCPAKFFRLSDSCPATLPRVSRRLLFINSLKWCDQIIQMRILYGYFFGKDIILILIWIIVHSYVLTFI